ncbi:MAG: hypothetical protein R3C32_14755 [Chloroflexota bacterium]
MVEDALARSGIALPRQALAYPPKVADHAWVELQVGSDLAGPRPHLAATPSSATLAPAEETLAQLPDDLRYRVRFDVLVERVQGDQLVTDGTLEYEGFADELAGTPVTFSHVTPSGLKVLGITVGALLGDGWVGPTDRPWTSATGRSWRTRRSASCPSRDAARTVLGTGVPRRRAGGPGRRRGDRGVAGGRVTPPGGARRRSSRRVRPTFRGELLAAPCRGGTPPGSVGPIALADLDDDGLPDYPPLLGLEAFAKSPQVPRARAR